MLGREPLAEAVADTPMALTGAGYVAVGGGASSQAAKLDKDGA